MRCRKNQHGQALIYGLFVLIGSLTGLFYLFNTGQLASEKTKLVNTADAVAYSAGVMHARALNFDAYNNRALMANEVLIAQMVSLASWTQYAQRHVENVPVIFPLCTDPYGAAATTLIEFDYEYGIGCYVLSQPGNPITLGVEMLAATVPGAGSALVTLVELNKKAIKAAEALLHKPDYFQRMRMNVMQQVAARNYVDDGLVTVHTAGANSGAGVSAATSALRDDWKNFTAHFTGNDRQRLAATAAAAARSIAFVNERRWESRATLPQLVWPCIGKRNEVRRRGGTSLSGLDEWIAEDTESDWQWHIHSHGFLGLHFSCDLDETPIAWGGKSAGQAAGSSNDGGNGLDDSIGDDVNGKNGAVHSNASAPAAWLGNSPIDNSSAHGNVGSSVWPQYTGIPEFYDLSDFWQASKDPRLGFTVRLERVAAQARTSDGASTIAASPRLNKFVTNFAGGVMSAMATSEVYFERPWFNSGDYSYSSGDTAYIVTQNQSDANTTKQTRELGSLFNPYWQVRLAANDAQQVRNQQSHQGAEMPK